MTQSSSKVRQWHELLGKAQVLASFAW